MQFPFVGMINWDERYLSEVFIATNRIGDFLSHGYLFSVSIAEAVRILEGIFKLTYKIFFWRIYVYDINI
jgi:hypothetical protein